MNHLRKMSLVNFNRLQLTQQLLSVLLIETITLVLLFSSYMHHFDNSVITIVKATGIPSSSSENNITILRDNFLSSNIDEIVKKEKNHCSSAIYTKKKSIAEREKDKIANQPKLTLLGKYSLTAYCACLKCCPTDTGMTASGVIAQSNHTVAFNGLPFGTEVYIEGHGFYIVEDTGAMSGFDIFFDDHQSALDFGRQSANVYIVERSGS